MRKRVLCPFAIASTLLVLAGCGDISHATRPAPVHEDLGWNKPDHVYELPWTPPAYGDEETFQERPEIDTEHRSHLFYPRADALGGIEYGPDN